MGNSDLATALGLLAGGLGGYKRAKSNKKEHDEDRAMKRESFAMDKRLNDLQIKNIDLQRENNQFTHDLMLAKGSPPEQAAQWKKEQDAILDQKLADLRTSKAQATAAEYKARPESLALGESATKAQIEESRTGSASHAANYEDITGRPMPGYGPNDQPNAQPAMSPGQGTLVKDLSDEDLSNVIHAMAQRESGGGTLGAAVKNNNPLNIKYGDFAAQFGAQQGTPAKDGGYFAHFPDPDTGMKAAAALLKTGGYQGLDLDSAMRRWSNNGYGLEILGGPSQPQGGGAPDGPMAPVPRWKREAMAYQNAQGAADRAENRESRTEHYQTYKNKREILEKRYANTINDKARAVVQKAIDDLDTEWEKDNATLMPGYERNLNAPPAAPASSAPPAPTTGPMDRLAAGNPTGFDAAITMPFAIPPMLALAGKKLYNRGMQAAPQAGYNTANSLTDWLTALLQGQPQIGGPGGGF